MSATADAAKLEQGIVYHLPNQGVDAAQVFEDQGDFYSIGDDNEGSDAGITTSENSRLEWGSRNFSRELVQTCTSLFYRYFFGPFALRRLYMT